MLLEDFREPLLSFQPIHFRYSFCHRTVTNWSSKYEILSLVGPLGEKTHFFRLLWDCWNFRNFEPSVNIQVALLKTFFGTIWIMLLLQIFEKLWNFIFTWNSVNWKNCGRKAFNILEFWYSILKNRFKTPWKLHACSKTKLKLFVTPALRFSHTWDAQSLTRPTQFFWWLLSSKNFLWMCTWWCEGKLFKIV